MPQIIGTILKVYPIVQLSTKSGQPFTKRDVVISVRRYDPMTGQPSDYTETPLITFFNDRCTQIDQFQIGQPVQISYELTGRRYTNASGEEFYATDVRGYRIEPYAGYRQTPQMPQAQAMPQPQQFIQQAQPTPVQPTPASPTPTQWPVQPMPQPTPAGPQQQFYGAKDGLPF
jgi:hypothetical protein